MRLWARTILLGSCLLAAALPTAARGSAAGNQAATADYYQRLLAGPQPQLAELSLLMTLMPKGGDLHHHYVGAVYAETYLDWAEQQGYCLYRTELTIETKPAQTAAGKECLPIAAVRMDSNLYRQVLMRWSTQDYDKPGHDQPPPDMQFFNSFEYFGAVGNHYQPGLQQLKARAKAENLQYIESMLASAPKIDKSYKAAVIDRLNTLPPAVDDATLQTVLDEYHDYLAHSEAFQKKIDTYLAEQHANVAGIDDADFTLRLQSYTNRSNPPATVFSGLYSAFVSVQRDPLFVGVNLLGPENGPVAMRDYDLHMRMLRYLKQKYPATPLSLHAGELAMGMVPPEGLRDHIRNAVAVAGAKRIGHGVDIAHEQAPYAILKQLREKDIAVEVNLSSNAIILGILGEAHPVNLYLRQHVPVVIATDDAGVARSSISNEYLLFASRYKPGYAQLKRVVYDSIRLSFLSPADKAAQRKALDARFAAFEATVAGIAKNK
ncbi:hypothetical protein [Chitinimonas sp.]|uniref:hypothetical protein n=1 Tax=Chitinimonas sp. TaxID=1934313 RepID=UPI002F93E1B6